MSKIFAIYPTDKKESTRFLNRINTYLNRKLSSDWHCYKIKFNDNDHNNCITQAKHNSAKMILFMGHGRSDYLHGSCEQQSHDFISADAINENNALYRNDNFINSSNIDNFRGKIFFSLSCNSNENKTGSIGRKAIENGILSFIGFGDIVTDYIANNNIPKKAIAVFKGAITNIIKESLFLAVRNNYTLDRLIDLIKILTNKEIQNLLLCSNHRHKKFICKKLYDFKDDIVVLGNQYETLY
jgi:hypothetical protein